MNKKPTTIVKFEITLSAPRSFVFENKSRFELPENAPVNPSDFPLCNNDRIITSAEHISNRTLIIFLPHLLHNYLMQTYHVLLYTELDTTYKWQKCH